ncbi:pyridoxal phosphate-dependent transferase [Cladochytrium replicatum]|nr:pyridoxal phosphate-dependent transferase [Cladochytrium replicatum]
MDLVGLRVPLVNEAAKELAYNLVVAVNTTYSIASGIYNSVPGASIVYKYVKASHQNDPFRTLLEGLLLAFMIWYWVAKRYKPGTEKFKLTDKEIDELCDEWEPEPLVPELTEIQKIELERTPVIVGPAGPKVTLSNGKTVLNVASYNFLGVMNSERVKEKAVETLRKYGVGTCGPPGFYGTLDVHQDLEAKLAEFVGAESAIIYSQAFSTIASALPAFAKRGDIIVADDGVNFAIQKGLASSRSVVKFYKHNDMEDLERVLKQVQAEHLKRKKPLTRRFLVSEAVSQNYGDIAPLPELVALKNKYKYRLILEESLSFGVLGKRGAGLADHFDIPSPEVDIMSASMANSLASGGGFVCGSAEIVEHQRLAGQAYTFSASLPAILAVSAIEAIQVISDNNQLLKQLRDNIATVRSSLAQQFSSDNSAIIMSPSYDQDLNSPVIHLRLRKRLANRSDEEKLLQEVVDLCLKDGVLVARAKYAHAQELHLPVASVRLLVTGGHSKKEAEKVADVVKGAFKRVLKSLK